MHFGLLPVCEDRVYIGFDTVYKPLSKSLNFDWGSCVSVVIIVSGNTKNC